MASQKDKFLYTGASKEIREKGYSMNPKKSFNVKDNPELRLYDKKNPGPFHQKKHLARKLWRNLAKGKTIKCTVASHNGGD